MDGPSFIIREDCQPISVERLKKDSGLDGQGDKYFHLIVVQDKSTGKLLGYAIYYYWFKTSRGKILYLEDLYIRESARGRKVGWYLMKHVAQIAEKTETVGMKLHVLDWNPARKFYEKLGAKYDGTIYHGWLEYEMDEESIEKLANQ